MNEAHGYRQSLLHNLRTVRERAGISASQLEEHLILGPGWITRFENGETTPSIDMVLAILHEFGANLSDLLVGLPSHPDAAEVERLIFVEQTGRDLLVNFRYAKFDASYTLRTATIQEFEAVIRTLRNGLSRLTDTQSDVSKAIKTDAVTRAFLKAVELWPDANPSDIW